MHVHVDMDADMDAETDMGVDLCMRITQMDAGVRLDADATDTGGVRVLGGAPRNPAHRNHLLAWIVKPSGCLCTDGHLTSRAFTEDRKIS